MSMLFLYPPSGRKEDERNISVESPQQLAAWFEENPGCVEWCRKDPDNLDALLEAIRAVERKGEGIADGLELLFHEGGEVDAEWFAGAVQRVLVDGGGEAEGVAEEWRKNREWKEAFESLPKIVEWCRKYPENLNWLLEVHRRMDGKYPGIADGLERLFQEGGDVGAEAFAAAVGRVLAEGCGVAEDIAEGWRKEREAKEAEKRRRWEEEDSQLYTPGLVKTLTLRGGVVLEMAWCPPGSFLMGSLEDEEGRRADETPHRVTLTKGFWMAKYPVTQTQWRRVMQENPPFWNGEDRPVTRVSWRDCQAFCEKAGNGLRLPTEAEWEYACRAGSETAYFWGDSTTGKHVENAVNAWGLCYESASEWCRDCYDAYSPGWVTDPAGPTLGRHRVRRCGRCRCAQRTSSPPHNRYIDSGFRPCCPEILP